MKSKAHSLCLLVLLVFASSFSTAQVKNDNTLFIGDDGTVFVGSGAYTFGTASGAKTETTRTSGNYGKLIFASGVTNSGATASHNINGYASIRTTATATLPVGQGAFAGPIQLTPSSTAAVDAAYYRAAATTVGATLDSDVSEVSSVEYWNIKGTNNAVITLSWGAFGANSSLAAMGISASLSKLTIVGYDGAKWVKIPTTVNPTSILGGASTVTTGSVSSTSAVNLNSFEYFSLGEELTTCPPLVAASGNTRTWSGSAWDTTPTIADAAIINGAYAGGSFVCNSLVLNADATLTNGQTAEIVNGVTGTGKFILSSEASVIQRNNASTAPNIQLNKRSRSVMRRYDYIYWGSPIATPTNVISQVAAAKASTNANAGEFAFDRMFKYVSGSGSGIGWQNLTSTELGRGFITRIKQQAPFTNASNTDYINLQFAGVANNGSVVVPITNNPAFPNSGSSHVLLANPYPSAIDADKFLTENNDIDGVVYIWTSEASNAGGPQQYSQSDYIAYNLAGFVVPGGVGTFNGKIASGQGFKVKSLTNSGNVTFNNCMRLAGATDNNNFFRTKKVAKSSKDSFKLNMTGANGVFSQILVAYMPEATMGYDRLYDAGRNSVSTAQLFSIFEGDGRRLAINARPDYESSDIVPIGISKSASTGTESFKISINQQEGVFANEDQAVYLYDSLNNTYHDLNKGDLTVSVSQNELDRFKLTYQAATLSNEEIANAGIVANIKNKAINITAKSQIKSVQVFDLAGRKIMDSKANNKNDFNAPFNFAKAVYIVKAQLSNGTVANLKLINEN